MRNILIFNQPVLDYTIPNLEYPTIKILSTIINFDEYHKKEIEIIAKTQLIGLLNKYLNSRPQNYTIEQFKDDDCLSILKKVFPNYS